jgi:osmotically-inducible protein OsmY
MRICIRTSIEQEESDMAFGNFWRGGERERYGSERDQDRNRWRSGGNDWRDEQRERWRDRDEQRYGASDRDRDEYGGRAGRSVTSDWESADPYGDRSRGHGGSGSGYGGERYYRGQGQDYGSQSGRGWGNEERESDYSGSRQGGSEYDYRGGSLYGGGFGRGTSDSYGTAGSYGQDYRSGSRYQAQGTNRGRGPRNYQRSDERIREDVCECLTQDDQIDASSIEVLVKDGEVTLTGTICERGDKRRAEDLAEGVSGVKDVRNNLRMQTEQGQQQSQQQSQTGQSPRH